MSDGTLNRRLGNVITDPSFNDKGPEARYCCLMNEIRRDPNAFVLFHRLTCVQFDYLRNQIEPHLHELPFSAALSLSLTLRYLSRDTGIEVPLELFGVSLSDIQFIVEEVYEAIIEVLNPKVFRNINYNELKEGVKHFNDMWRFPDCYGAIDFRSITCQYSIDGCSVKTRMDAYMGFVADAFCRFSTWLMCDPVKIVEQETAPSGPFSDCLDDDSFYPYKYSTRFFEVFQQINDDGYVTLGSEDSNLTGINMRPFDTVKSCSQAYFNCRLERAKSVIDNALGILFRRWRIFHWPLDIKDGTLEKIVQCAIVLHNWLIDEDLSQDYFRRSYLPKGLFVLKDRQNRLLPGDWGRYSITAGVQRIKTTILVETLAGERKRRKLSLRFLIIQNFYLHTVWFILSFAAYVHRMLSLKPRSFMP